jgi:O-acetyl-ADP-ribose deacetylase (regulator of RNase III)
MSQLTYVVGDATRPAGNGPRIIVHVCNDIGGWGAGFVMAISRRWSDPEESYRRWHAENGDVPFQLGQVQFVEVEDSLWVANMIGQHGIRRSGSDPPIRYDAVRSGLHRVAEFAIASGASVHMPRIGCGLAGGSWDQMEPIIIQTLVEAGVEATVYDLG